MIPSTIHHIAPADKMMWNDQDMKTYVSLTTIQGRQKFLVPTLKSLLGQTKRPDKIYLYVSEEPYLLDRGFKNKNLGNEELKSILQDPIFEVVWTENTGPYRKLLPTLKKHWDDDCYIITVDDDCSYSDNIVKDYTDDVIKHECVVTYRGFTPRLEDDNLGTFKYGNRKPLEERSRYNFATGLGGIIYHPKFFKATNDLIFNRDQYNRLCDKNDDVWFYMVRIANEVDCVALDKTWRVKNYQTETGLFINFNQNKRTDLNSKCVVNTFNYLKEYSKSYTQIP